MVNPFERKAPLPPGTRGERGFRSAQDAQDNAKNAGVQDYALMEASGEYAWISPAAAFAVRAIPAMNAGIRLIGFSR